MQKCCVSGFNWKGTPKGKIERFADHEVYISGSNKERAILYIHDGYGWEFSNNRLLADHLADELDATVYLPDLYVHSVAS